MQLKADREGKIRPQCTECGWVYYKNPLPVPDVLPNYVGSSRQLDEDERTLLVW